MNNDLAELPNTRQNNQALGKIAKALEKSPNIWQTTKQLKKSPNTRQNYHIEGKITQKLAKLPSTNFFFYFDFFILINSNIGSSALVLVAGAADREMSIGANLLMFNTANLKYKMHSFKNQSTFLIKDFLINYYHGDNFRISKLDN